MGRKVVADPAVRSKLREEPRIGEAGMLCVQAWRRLDSTRQRTAMTIGMGGSAITTGPIPWPEIRDWCAWKGLGRSATEIVVSVLSRLDVDHAKREAGRIAEFARKK